MPTRAEKKLLNVLDALADLAEQRGLVEAELEMHRHINDDAQRDAALGMDRLEATATRDDVARFERLLADMDRRRSDLEARRQRIQDQL